ncbi:MAG: hypothetical protein HYV36_06380 [Lentisphaerae bacterium]|nr:hypothetical protein [Lentisphaerota bacterium]
MITKTYVQRVGLAALVLAFVGALLPSKVSAVANFTRKYGVDCATCHAPAVPRLNAFGHEFRKRGFRMEEEIGQSVKPQAYKEIGDWASLRLRSGYAVENFDDRQKASSSGNSYETRNGFRKPDYTLFYAGALTKNLSMFTELEWDDVDEVALQAYGAWFGGDVDHSYLIRLGQMHTLQRIGFGGFDRPTGISTPDVLSSTLTASPVPFKIGNDQRGIDFACNFTPSSRAILGLYNGMDFEGHGAEGNGQGFGDSDGSKDGLLAIEQMIGESGFTLFGYAGQWTQEAGTKVSIGTNKVALADSSDETRFDFARLGATASIILPLINEKMASEVQGGYMRSIDVYPDNYPTGTDRKEGDAFWVGVEQRLPHEAAVVYRFDYVDKKDDVTRQKNTVGVVYTVLKYLRLAAEVFAYNQKTDSAGANLQAMLNF